MIARAGVGHVSRGEYTRAIPILSVRASKSRGIRMHPESDFAISGGFRLVFDEEALGSLVHSFPCDYKLKLISRPNPT